MQQASARIEPTFADSGDGVIVRRLCATDAIGKALRQAFVPDQGVPGELMRSLDSLDTKR